LLQYIIIIALTTYTVTRVARLVFFHSGGHSEPHKKNLCHQLRFHGLQICQNCFCDRGFTLDHAGRTYSAPLDALAGIMGKDRKEKRGGWELGRGWREDEGREGRLTGGSVIHLPIGEIEGPDRTRQ